MKMNIHVKSLKVPHFEIEVNHDDTVDVVKQKIEDVLGSDYPKARQILISQKKFLKGETTLDENIVMNNSSIFMVLPKVIDTGVQHPSNTPQYFFAQLLANVISDLAPDPSTNAPAVSDGNDPQLADDGWNRSDAYYPQLAADDVWNRSDGYDPQLAFDLFHEAVQEIVDNTFGAASDRTTVTRELGACLNNLGIHVPETRPASPSPASSQASNCPTALDIADTGSSSTSRLPIFSENQIINNPQFIKMRARIQHRPTKLQQIVDELEQESPILFNQIQTYPITFLSLMRETELDGLRLPSKKVVSAFLESSIVTPEDRVTIDQLVAMGFHRSVVVQVYFSFLGNEDLALMYLATKE